VTYSRKGVRAFVRFSTAAGTCELVPGDIIGRIAAAALRIDDPRVSEAHALVSLRRGALYLLSLRRMFAVAGTPTSEVQLEVGCVVELADGIALTVVEVATPAKVLALRAPGLGPLLLSNVASVQAGPPLALVGRFVPGAAAHLWSAGTSWRLRVGDGPDRTVGAGDRFVVGDQPVELVAVAIGTASPASTQLDGGVDDPLRIVAHYDTVEVHRAGRPPFTLGGQSAKLFSELVAFRGPVAWETAARQLWTDGSDLDDLRHRWDVAVGRLRRRLRGAGVRNDLIVADHAGQLQLVLYARDVVEDRT